MNLKLNIAMIPEMCDNEIDDDCDGLVDEDCPYILAIPSEARSPSGVYDGDDFWPEVRLTKEVSIYGSFSGDETHRDDRDLRMHRTIIDNVYAPIHILRPPPLG